VVQGLQEKHWILSSAVLGQVVQDTRARLAYNTYRNFFPPARQDVYAGFRTCAR
jgi:hypothetical protein